MVMLNPNVDISGTVGRRDVCGCGCVYEDFLMGGGVVGGAGGYAEEVFVCHCWPG